MTVYTIKFYFYGNKNIIPFKYRDELKRFLHAKVLGKDNKYHNPTSLYSISPLFNSKTVDNGLIFEKGAIWLIRTPNFKIYKDIYDKGKNAIGEKLFTLTLKDVDSYETEFKDINEILVNCEPIYLNIKRFNKHETYTHENGKKETTELMKNIFKTKSKLLGYNFNDTDFNIEFVYDDKIKTKTISTNSILARSTISKIKITGSSDVIGLCYGFGIGLSSGCSRGFIYNIR